MLDAAIATAKLGDIFEAVLSVETAGVFKPAAAVYQLAVDQFGCAAGAIAFVSSNGWDAQAAAAFGMQAVWCNRGGCATRAAARRTRRRDLNFGCPAAAHRHNRTRFAGAERALTGAGCVELDRCSLRFCAIASFIRKVCNFSGSCAIPPPSTAAERRRGTGRAAPPRRLSAALRWRSLTCPKPRIFSGIAARPTAR